MVNATDKKYGYKEFSYLAAGEIEGLTKLVDAFYRNMEEFPLAKKILDMHPKDLGVSREKLAYFLSAWLGGPRLYQEKYGAISIPKVHQHLDIGTEERDAWLSCMSAAIDEQPYEEEFKKYLLAQLHIPAERVRLISRSSD